MTLTRAELLVLAVIAEQFVHRSDGLIEPLSDDRVAALWRETIGADDPLHCPEHETA